MSYPQGDYDRLEADRDRLRLENDKLKKREDAVLASFQKTIIGGSKVKHRADGALGVVNGQSTHPVYDLDVVFDNGVSPCYRKNLLPEWWPWPY